jgi:rhodanese-related sulfurtransferase/thiol-disulfide isomerase/thioredoxin/predicted small secreted protein
MKKLIPALLVLSLLFLTACGGMSSADMSSAGTASTAPAAEVKTITAEAAKARMDSGDPVVILDVRTAEEYAAAHISGAVLLPVESIGSEKPAELPVTDAEILVYCRSGNRSAQAAKKLVGLGYTNVSDFGGIKDWTYGTVTGEWAQKSGTWSSFRAATIQGAPVDESIFSGHRLNMVNVWATFCSPCLNEMPDLGKLPSKYDSADFQIIGVPIDTLDSSGAVSQSQVELARSLAEQTGAGYTHLLPTADLMSAGLNGVSAVPTTFFFDSTGKQVGQAYEGARSAAEWQAIIDGLLAETGA